MIGMLLQILHRHVQRTIHVRMKGLYPDKIERAAAYLSMGATELQVSLFGEGETLSEISITRYEDGWEIEYFDGELEEA